MKRFSAIQVVGLIGFITSLGLLWFSLAKGYSYSYGYLVITVCSIGAVLVPFISRFFKNRVEKGLSAEESADTKKQPIQGVSVASRVFTAVPRFFGWLWGKMTQYASTGIQRLAAEFVNEQGGHLEKGWIVRFFSIFGAAIVVFFIFVLFVIGAGLLSYHLGGTLYGYSKTAFYITYSLLFVAFAICTTIAIAVCVAINRAWKDYIRQHSFVASASNVAWSAAVIVWDVLKWVILGVTIPVIHYIGMLSRGQPDLPGYFFSTIILTITAYFVCWCVWGEVKIYLDGVSPEFRSVIDPVEFKPGEDIPWRPKEVKIEEGSETVSVSTTMVLQIERMNVQNKALFQAVQEAEIERYNSKVRKARKKRQTNYGLIGLVASLVLCVWIAFMEGGFNLFLQELEESVVSISLILSIVACAVVFLHGLFTKLALDGDVVADGQTGEYVADEVFPQGSETQDDLPELDAPGQHGSVASEEFDFKAPGNGYAMKVFFLIGYVAVVAGVLFLAKERGFSVSDIWALAITTLIVFCCVVVVFVVPVGAFAVSLSSKGWNVLRHRYDGIGLGDFVKYHTVGGVLTFTESDWRSRLGVAIKQIWDHNQGWDNLAEGDFGDVDLIDSTPLNLMLRYDEMIRGGRALHISIILIILFLVSTAFAVFASSVMFAGLGFTKLGIGVILSSLAFCTVVFFVTYLRSPRLKEIDAAFCAVANSNIDHESDEEEVAPSYSPDIDREKTSGKLQLLRDDVAVLAHAGKQIGKFKRFMASAFGGVVVRTFMALGFLWKLFEKCAWLLALLYLVVVGCLTFLQRGSEWWLKAQTLLSWYHSWYALIPLAGYAFLLLHRRFQYEFKLLPISPIKRRGSTIGDRYEIQGWTAMWDQRGEKYCEQKLAEENISLPAGVVLTREAWLDLFQVYQNKQLGLTDEEGNPIGELRSAELERPGVQMVESAQQAYQDPWRRLAVLGVVVGGAFVFLFFANRNEENAPTTPPTVIAKADLKSPTQSLSKDLTSIKKLRKELARTQFQKNTALAVLRPLFKQCKMEFSLDALASSDGVAKQLAACLKAKKGVKRSWYRRQYRKAQRSLRKVRSMQRKLQERLVQLQKEKKTSDVKLRGKISGLKAEVGNLKAAKSRQTQRITRLTGKLQKVRGEKTSLQAKLTAQRGELVAAKTAKDRLEGRVVSLKRELAGQKALALRKAARARRARFKALRLAHKKRLAAARKKQAALKKRLAAQKARKLARKKARLARAKRAARLKRRRARALARKRRLARKKRSRKRGGSAQDGLW